MSELPDEIKEPFKIINEHIFIPSNSQQEAFKAISNAYDKLIVKKDLK